MKWVTASSITAFMGYLVFNLLPINDFVDESMTKYFTSSKIGPLVAFSNRGYSSPFRNKACELTFADLVAFIEYLTSLELSVAKHF
jgi:hypothetical protein